MEDTPRKDYGVLDTSRLSRRSFNRWLAGGILAVPVFGALLAACGGDDDEGSSQSDNASQGSSDTQSDDSPSEQENTSEEPAKEGGSLVFAYAREPETLDPHKTTSVIADDWMSKLYDSLVALDFDLATYLPGLAEEWEISDDGRTMTFHLRQGVKFHSGAPLKSSDVKFTIERWLADETGSPTAARIQGVTSVDTPDEQTAVLNLDDRNNEIIYNLASGFGSILNQEFVEEKGEDYGHLFVDGTGPFKLEEWNPRDRAVFKKNPDYTWGPTAYENQGPVHVDELVLRVIPEDITRSLELESGNVHVVPDIPPSEASKFEGDGDDVQIIEGKGGATEYLGMNMRMDLMSDKNKPVREAVMYTIDKPTIVQDILYGYAEVAYGPVAPWIKGALPDVEEFGYHYDPDKARSILDEAGWVPGDDGIREKDGVRLHIPLYASATGTNREMMGIFSSNFADVGIEIESVLIEEAAFWGRVAAGEHTIMLTSMPHSDPDEILMFYFLSTNQPAPNRFGFADPEVDEWLKEARRTPDEEKWLDYYYKIQKRVLETAFWLPLFHPYDLIGVSSGISGYQYYGLYNTGSFKLLDVSIK